MMYAVTDTAHGVGSWPGPGDHFTFSWDRGCCAQQELGIVVDFICFCLNTNFYIFFVEKM